MALLQVQGQQLLHLQQPALGRVVPTAATAAAVEAVAVGRLRSLGSQQQVPVGGVHTSRPCRVPLQQPHPRQQGVRLLPLQCQWHRAQHQRPPLLKKPVKTSQQLARRPSAAVAAPLDRQQAARSRMAQPMSSQRTTGMLQQQAAGGARCCAGGGLLAQQQRRPTCSTRRTTCGGGTACARCSC